MTTPRQLPNVALWGLEDIYKELEKAEALLAALVDPRAEPTRTTYILNLSNTRLALSRAREKVISLHPKACQPRRGLASGGMAGGASSTDEGGAR